MNPAKLRKMLEAVDAAAGLLGEKRASLKLAPVATPTFRGAALALQEATDAEVIIEGPSETGKTFACLWKLDTLLRTTPRAQAGILRRVRATLAGTVLLTLDKIIEIRGGVWKSGGERVNFYEYENGARLWCGGMDDPGKVFSSERDWIYVNQCEQLSLDHWENLTQRTTGRGRAFGNLHPMLFGDCNPGPRHHWILNRPSIRLLSSRHKDNPSLYDDDGNLTEQGVRSMGQLQKQTGVRFLRYYLGEWVSVEGAVYRFDREAHLKTREWLPQVRRWVCGVDFGYKNPFCWQRWAIDGDGRMWLEREIYMTGKTVAEFAVQIRRLNAGYVIEATVCDHDPEGQAVLNKAGILTMNGFKAVEIGIQNVESRIALAGDGKPRLFILDDACEERDSELSAAHKPTCTLEEFGDYHWRIAEDGKPLKEEPVKENDHGMDTMRMVAAYLDNLHIAGTGVFRASTGDVAVYAAGVEAAYGGIDDDEGRGPGDAPEEERYQEDFQ